MTDLERKAVQRVFELLEIAQGDLRDAKEILRQALAQPEQKKYITKVLADGTFITEPLPIYTAPPKREWVGLTDEEKKFLKDSWLNLRDIDKLIYTVDELLKRRTHD